MNFTKLNQSQLSKAIGFSARSIRRWQQEGLKTNTDGTFDLRKVLSWLLDRAADQNGKAEPSKWLEEWRKHRAAIAKIELKKLEGSILLKTDVEKAFTDRAYEFCRRLKILSRRIAQEVAGGCKQTLKDVTTIIDAEVYSMMAEYSRPMEINKDN